MALGEGDRGALRSARECLSASNQHCAGCILTSSHLLPCTDGYMALFGLASLPERVRHCGSVASPPAWLEGWLELYKPLHCCLLLS